MVNVLSHLFCFRSVEHSLKQIYHVSLAFSVVSLIKGLLCNKNLTFLCITDIESIPISDINLVPAKK